MKVLAKDDCGFVTALSAIGGKWKSAILWEIVEEPVRFGHLRRRVAGISEKVLTQQLREMEADGLIRRSDLGGLVRHVEYSATDVGRSLNEAVDIMSRWGKQHGRRLAMRKEAELGDALPGAAAGSAGSAVASPRP